MSDFLERFRRLELTVFISCLLAMMISCAVWTAVRTGHDIVALLLFLLAVRLLRPACWYFRIKRSCLLFLEESRKFREEAGVEWEAEAEFAEELRRTVGIKPGESVADR